MLDLTCKCGAKTYEEHTKAVRDGYPGHTYRVNGYQKGTGK